MRNIIAIIFVTFVIILNYPITSKASDYLASLDLEGFAVDIDSLSDFNGSMIKELRYDNTSLYCNINIFNRPVSDRVTPFSSVRYAYLLNSSRTQLSLYRNSNTSYSQVTGYKYYYYSRINGDNENATSAYQVNLSVVYLNNSNMVNIKYTNIPIFDDEGKMSNYLIYGIYDPEDIKNSDYLESLPENISIGHIAKTSYKLDNTSILQSPSNFREYVSWDNMKSSSGYEYSDNDKVKFFIKDRSYKTKVNNIGPGEVLDQVVNQLQKWVYPKGSAQNMLASGEAIKTSSYGNMVYVGEQLATLGNFSFNSLSKMQNLSDSDMQNYLSQLTGGTGTYSWMTKVSNFVSGNSINVNVAYDIYCYIQSGSKNGNWYRINFHDTPVPQRGDRVYGGITASPVMPRSPFIPDETGDWFNAPEFDDKDDNEQLDENNKDDNGLSVYYYTDDGDTYITNNYTYNYDNRSWVENHFDNNTIDEVNEGFEWIKLFGGIFSIFLTLFGAFLPGWAVAVVTISIPIIIGLILFKVIKGVVPFV